MKIEAITTCVGANSLRMLEFTLPFNREYFDNFIVLTVPEDKFTQSYCINNNVQVITTDAFYKHQFKFNKGAAINIGMTQLKYNDYIAHIDSDIICPNNYRTILEKEIIDKECFYGSRRFIVPNKKDFLNLIQGLKKEEDFTFYPGIGYGYIQIWNINSYPIRVGYIYPEIYEKGDSDWKWRNLWGNCINGDWEYTGKLRRISANVAHLGLPDISGTEEFWKE